MAYTQDEKSTGLDSLSSLANGDLIIVGDVSDSGRAKTITKTDFISDVTNGNTVIQSGLQFEDEGVNLGTAGTVDEIDFVGTPVTATRAGNKVTVTIAAGSATNASTAVAGVVQEATQSEVNAGTGTGSTGARLFVNPSTLGAAILAYITAQLSTFVVLLLSYVVSADENVVNNYTWQLPIISNGNEINGWVNTNITVPTVSVLNGTGAGGWIHLNPSNTNAVLTASLPGASSTDDTYNTNSVIRMKLRAKFDTITGKAGFGAVENSSNLYDAQTAVNGDGMRFVNNNGSLYAVNSDGVATTNTDISSGLTLTNWNTYQIIFTPSSNVKFYVNGTLKATHTTNLPASQTGFFGYGSSANGEHIDTFSPVISLNIS